MATPKIYTNKDLNKSITGSKSRVYTNADLDVEDDFIPDEVNDDFIEDDFIPDDESNTVQTVSENEPDTWMKGFVNSITSGDALDAGLQGAKGWLKGATLDIPQTIIDMAGGVKEGFLNKMRGSSSGLDVDSPGSSIDLTYAGSKPEEFGRTMGQMTGQPLVTAGVVKGAPGATRLAGYPVEAAGKVIKNYGIGMPRILESRLQRGVERGVGKGIEKLGSKMKTVGTKKPTNPDVKPTVIENQPIPKSTKLDMPLTEGDELVTPPKTFKVINQESNIPSKIKPKVRPNKDGTFTNMDTGEVLDAKGQPIIEYNGKPISRDSPFFKKNQSEVKKKSELELHTIEDLQKIANQQGNVNLYHGTTSENAKSILKEGIKLPPSGEFAAQTIANKYGIPWAEWKNFVEPDNIGSGYGNATKRLSTAPLPIANRWSKNFPQGEIYSDLNSKARMWKAAKAQKRTKDFDTFYEEVSEKQRKAGGNQSIYELPDYAGKGADNLMSVSQSGEILSLNVDVRAIPKNQVREAKFLLEQINKKLMTKEQALEAWNNTYKDIKIAPQNIKNIRPIKYKGDPISKDSPFFLNKSK